MNVSGCHGGTFPRSPSRGNIKPRGRRDGSGVNEQRKFREQSIAARAGIVVMSVVIGAALLIVLAILGGLAWRLVGWAWS